MLKEFLKPFDIVSAPYVDLEGNIKSFSNGNQQKGLFMVVAVDNGNVIACKVTSQSTLHNSPDFTYTLLQDSHQFLRATSYIQLTKPHTLGVPSCQKIGEVALFCRAHIKSQLKLLFDTIGNILQVNIPVQKYVSPNIIPRRFGGVVIKK
jgi:hypothetical protein